MVGGGARREHEWRCKQRLRCRMFSRSAAISPRWRRPVATERSLRQIYEDLLNRDDFGGLSRTNKYKGVSTILLYGRLPQVLAKHAVAMISETYRQELQGHALMVVGRYRKRLAEERSRALPQPSIRYSLMAGAGTSDASSSRVDPRPPTSPLRAPASPHAARPSFLRERLTSRMTVRPLMPSNRRSLASR